MLSLYRLDKKYCLLLLPLVLAGFLIHFKFWLTPADALKNQDIYFIWLEGKRIISGENPYARVLLGDMRNNDKYATYFPLAYLFSALVQKLGFLEFRDWLYFWRPISFSFHIGIVALILRYFQIRGLWIIGFVASTIILLGRWSIYIVRVHHLEFAAIFFLILSLVLLKEKTKFSLLMFSISLGIKQIAIFLLPLYLIYIWKNAAKNRRIKHIIWGFLIIFSIPFLTSLPFLIWDAEAFFKSILFSGTRLASSHITDAPSVDVIFSQKYPWIVGLRAKLLMLFLMGMIYLSFLKEKVSMFVSSTITMMIFLYFNSVLFLQYFLWSLCIIPFALVELIPLSSQQNKDRPNF
ncbi:MULTISPECIES: hypothetical protein [Calothrix]|uniref:Glycosyltransferase RgtA/B/C/D-like domain-containing protein n=2 Tax=Calothrix TaxID=1186 RepID=A0ABR8A3S1_9CYAN|nr:MULTISPECIES: hypothetical protein [Calothrix]MBD2194616.1 hypothetical protein [Calothrix parietina FACHB-288]MBD2223278.1 hypothetical protein [Calothrix anomala FACHB-343]